jgi:hypothetical protein
MEGEVPDNRSMSIKTIEEVKRRFKNGRRGAYPEGVS